MSIISVKNLEKRLGNDLILRGANAEIEKGEVISIIGSSGAGKSTFLRAINFLDPPTGGEVFFDGVKLTKENADAARRRMNMVFQNFGLFGHLDVIGNITAGPVKLLKKTKQEAEEKALQLLKTVGLAERARFFPRQLSSGQKQRVAIARCLAMSPEVILFDEPTNELDSAMVSEVMAVMRGLAKSGITMLVVTHNLDFAREASTRVFYMDEGVIHEDGSPAEIFGRCRKPKTREFIFKIRSFNYEISNRDFDYVEMLGGVENFCFRHAIEKKTANKLRLLAEELILNIVVPKYGACSLNLSFSEKLGHYELSVTYGGEKNDVMEEMKDDLSAMMVIRSARKLRHEYHPGDGVSGGKNVITTVL